MLIPFKGSRKWEQSGVRIVANVWYLVSDHGDLYLFTYWRTCSFCVQIQFPFPFLITKWIGNYFDSRLCAANFGASIYSWVINTMDLFFLQNNSRIEAPCVNGNADRICGANYEPDLNSRIFFLLGPCAQINWRVISRKVLFDPHCFLTNKSPTHFAGESGKGNTFLNGKGHVQNKNRHRLPRSQTYAQQLKNLNPPYFSFRSTFKVLLHHSSKKKVIKKLGCAAHFRLKRK
jgi:hypothetical protein